MEIWFKFREELILIAIFLLVATSSFALGKLSEREKFSSRGEVKILNKEGFVATAATASDSIVKDSASALKNSQKEDTAVIVSRGGKKYHYSWCSGAKTINEKNKITFASAALAEAAGYTLAANCTAP